MYTLYNTSTHKTGTSQNSTYIYDIILTGAGLAAISSDDSLRLLDPSQLDGAPLNSVRQVNRDVTCLRVLNQDAGIVVTGGRDGRVVITDLRSGERVGEVSSGEFSKVSQEKKLDFGLSSLIFGEMLFSLLFKYK